MFRASSLVLRGLLAIGLMCGFYGLALAVAWGLSTSRTAEIVWKLLDWREK
jgi:hypothetical protein